MLASVATDSTQDSALLDVLAHKADASTFPKFVTRFESYTQRWSEPHIFRLRVLIRKRNICGILGTTLGIDISARHANLGQLNTVG